MSVQNYECLIDITSDSRLKYKFSEIPRVEFWCSVLQEYSQLSKCAELQLLPFPTNYLCEAGFSRYVAKNLNIVTVSKSQPTCELSCLQALRILNGFRGTNKQHHSSH